MNLGGKLKLTGKDSRRLMLETMMTHIVSFSTLKPADVKAATF